MYIKDYILRGLKLSYRKITGKKFLPAECDYNRESSNERIYNLLTSDKPCMISRLGSTEAICVNNYIAISDKRPMCEKIWDYITDNTQTPWWFEDHFHFMNIYSGIFPEGKDIAERFAKRYLQDIPEIDLLGCWLYSEKFMPLREDVQKVYLEMLYPFFVKRPWTLALKGKKVLVIHPFEETIKQQYAKRELLFDDKNILPEFELKVLKAVQSVAGIKTEYKDWFEALHSMEEKISLIDFDIAIIGCGAYGLPLAAYIKRMGKKAIHMGGGTQLLFGIYGKRWLEEYKDTKIFNGHTIDVNYKRIFNEHWCYPLDIDTPKNAFKVDNACYWK